jgi:hypothetical protein
VIGALTLNDVLVAVVLVLATATPTNTFTVGTVAALINADAVIFVTTILIDDVTDILFAVAVTFSAKTVKSGTVDAKILVIAVTA